MAGLRNGIELREAELKRREETIVEAEDRIQQQVASKLEEERPRISADEARKARLALTSDIEAKNRIIADQSELVSQLNERLTEAQTAQAELTREKRDLERAKQELPLTIEKEVSHRLTEEESRIRRSIESEHTLKDLENEQRLNSLKTELAGAKQQLAAAQRKIEQGSQQLQGEVQELELETLLREHFRRDEIVPVRKGECGGDVLQRVISNTGQHCGTIIWESKRTQSWGKEWPTKLRGDQSRSKADVSVIVSQALPKEIDAFGLVDGVHVTNRKCAIPLAAALREYLIELWLARKNAEGQETKAIMVFKYFTGPQFKRRVETIREAFDLMQKDLKKEKEFMQKQWAKRENQISGIIEATLGMYGDLQGIAGRSMQEIEGLDIPALDSAKAA